MTSFLTLQDLVRRYSKTSNREPELVQLIRDAINVAVFEIARERKWTELLTLRYEVDLTGVLAAGVVSLPSDFMAVERVKYAVTVPTPVEWRLYLRTDIVPPARMLGKPKAYAIGSVGTLGNSAIFLEPFDNIDADIDDLLIDYYRIPPLLQNDTDQIVSNNWDAEVIKRANHYILTYQNKIPAAREMWNTILGREQSQKQSDSE